MLLRKGVNRHKRRMRIRTRTSCRYGQRAAGGFRSVRSTTRRRMREEFHARDRGRAAQDGFRAGRFRDFDMIVLDTNVVSETGQADADRNALLAGWIKTGSELCFICGSRDRRARIRRRTISARDRAPSKYLDRLDSGSSTLNSRSESCRSTLRSPQAYGEISGAARA